MYNPEKKAQKKIPAQEFASYLHAAAAHMKPFHPSPWSSFHFIHHSFIPSPPISIPSIFNKKGGRRTLTLSKFC